MNKKGFTLIEVTAVIALISIVMMLVIPNVASIFGSARKDIFKDETINIYGSAYTTYITRSSNGDYSKRFCVGSDITLNELEIESKNGLYYDITVNNYGEVLNLKITNENYSITLNNENGIKKKEITTDKITDKITINCN